MMGCGKTTIGKILSEKLNFGFIDCDEYLEKKYNTTIKDCFNISENYFRELESICLEEVSKLNSNVISTGGGAVKNKKNMDIYKNDIVIFINRPLNDILSDIACEHRPLISNQNNNTITNIYNERIQLYKKYCTYEVANDKKIDLVIDEIISIIKKH